MSYSKVLVEDCYGNVVEFNHVESIQRDGKYIVLTVTTGDITMLPVEQYRVVEKHCVIQRRRK